MSDHPRYAEHVEFDEGNESELARHNVTPLDVTRLLLNQPVWAPNKKGRGGLWLAVGRTEGRALCVPVRYDSLRRSLRPITAWDASSGERQRFLGREKP